MSMESSITIPVWVKPGFWKDRFHKMHITKDSIQIRSWENIYRNGTSELLWEIPVKNIIDIRFKMPRSTTYISICHVSYRDENRRTRQIRFYVCQPNGRYDNELTGKIATILEELCWQKKDALPTYPIFVPLRPPSSMHKFLAGLILFAGSFIAEGVGFSKEAIIVMGVFVFFPSLIAIGIDYVWVYKGWPPFIKLISYILIFLTGFGLLILTIGFVDSRL